MCIRVAGLAQAQPDRRGIGRTPGACLSREADIILSRFPANDLPGGCTRSAAGSARFVAGLLQLAAQLPEVLQEPPRPGSEGVCAQEVDALPEERR